MADEQTPNVETDATAEEPTGGDNVQQADTSGINPAWDAVRNELDPISFSKIEKHLKDIDAAGQQRFTKLNEDFRWAKELQDKKVSPDRINQALQFADSLDQNPETVYEQLGQFLRDNGRMPETQAELQQNVDEHENDDENLNEDPRIAALQQQQQLLLQQQEQQMQFLAQQEEAREIEKIENQIKGELAQLEESRKDLSRPDIGEILKYAAHEGTSIADAVQWFDGLKNRFLSAPRPGDSAPQLLPTSGGVPSSGNTKSLGQMTPSEVQALVAGGINANRPR